MLRSLGDGPLCVAEEMLSKLELSMKRFKTPASRHLWVLAGCLSAFLVVACIQGCSKKEPAPKPPKQEPAAAPAAQGEVAKPKPNAVVVTVNGSPITEGQLDQRMMTELKSRYGPSVARLDPRMVDQAKKGMRSQAIDVMVSEKLLDDQIKAAGLKITDKDVEAAINTEAAKWTPPSTFEGYKKMVMEQGGDFNDIMTSLKVSLSRQKFLESQWAGKADVNEAQAKAFYDANQTTFERSEEVRASHILVKINSSDPNADPNRVKAAAKDKAGKLLEKIKAGADFAEVAKANSDDPGSAPKGGDLDFFPRGEMEKPFEDAAFALEPNKVSDVVETRFGYHIIKQTGHRPTGVVPFDEIKKELMAQMTDQKRSHFLEGYITSLRDKAKIVYASQSDAPPPQPNLEAIPGQAPTSAKPQADANQPKPAPDPNRK
jgi:peptidyl-prolyl cis-trans isomerase C